MERKPMNSNQIGKFLNSYMFDKNVKEDRQIQV